MSLTVILADYFAGSISTSDALRRSGFGKIDDLVSAVRNESETRQRQKLQFGATTAADPSH